MKKQSCQLNKVHSRSWCWLDGINLPVIELELSYCCVGDCSNCVFFLYWVCIVSAPWTNQPGAAGGPARVSRCLSVFLLKQHSRHTSSHRRLRLGDRFQSLSNPAIKEDWTVISVVPSHVNPLANPLIRYYSSLFLHMLPTNSDWIRPSTLVPYAAIRLLLFFYSSSVIKYAKSGAARSMVQLSMNQRPMMASYGEWPFRLLLLRDCWWEPIAANRFERITSIWTISCFHVWGRCICRVVLLHLNLEWGIVLNAARG